MNKIREKISDELIYLYNTGKLHHAYRVFGAHPVDGGVQFTLWVPGVRSVKVVGDFNDWGGDDYLEQINETGIYTAFIANAGEGDKYKYDIELQNGRHQLKADPYAFASEMRPRTASKVSSASYNWKDSKWMKNRAQTNLFAMPMNIYEVHLGSWKRYPGEDGFYSYKELADQLVPYVKDMGYTHVEIMPVMEHPLDASWGYQVTGYFAPSARSGKPEDFKHLVDEFHKAGIGVILDWVPGHFCPDEQGLREFNGEQLYESEMHPDWGTYKFDFSRPQVRSFLLSNATYWLEEYHADGIRVDGVSSILYMNFGVTDRAKMKFNKYGGEGDLQAMDFLKELNFMIGTEIPGTMSIAEESTAWPMVTWPPADGGLGFHYKWSMGWMHDTLEYMQCDFPWRSGSHNKLTFSMTYAYSENFILPLSHDEVVHGKCSLIGRMPGDTWRQFAGIRVLAMYQMTHPGKKLNFMGHEIAQFIEWREYEGLEWFLLEYDNHKKYQKFIKDLNHVYKEHPALWENDINWEGFQWIDANNSGQNILSYVRRSNPGPDSELLVVVLNMDVQAYNEYEIGVPEPGYYKEIISSDDAKYAGAARENSRQIKAKKKPMHGMPYSICIRMPVLGGAIFERKKETRTEKKKTTKSSKTSKAAKTAKAEKSDKKTVSKEAGVEKKGKKSKTK